MVINILKNSRIKDITSLLQPCFFLCRLHGLFPYKFNAMEISLSKPWYIISLVIMTTYTSSVSVIFYLTHISGVLKDDSVPGILQEIVYWFLCTFVGILTVIISVSRVSFLQDLFRISINVPKEAFQNIGTFVHMKDIFGFIFLIGQIANVYDKNRYIYFSKVNGIYATLVIFLTDALYMNCVIVVYICFKNINANLIELRKNNTVEESSLMMPLFHKRRYPLLLLKLRFIKRVHHALSDVVEKLNSTFSLQIVASVTLTFFEVTFSLYFYFLRLREMKTINIRKQVWYSYFITSATFYCAKLIGIILVCQLSKDEAIKTGTLVHEILIDTKEPQFKEEVRIL